ncbi:MAG TPA: hypothetical protein VG166_06810 [Caulobacteraceae bacterium]|nr:hypothetical protein [Caulobacteraceae bacterium]
MTSIGSNEVLAVGDESPSSGVSWAAVIAGAVVAAAVSLVLVVLGSGLGFASVSPWRGNGPSAATFGIMTGLWLILTQWLASAAGGYLAGRLRTRWPTLHVHEVFFRDTAHGFLTWGLASLLVAALVAMAATVGTAATAANPGAGGPLAYQSDVLLRSPRGDDSPNAAALHAEVARTLARNAKANPATADDRAYLATLVTARSGATPDVARARVDAAVDAVRKAADDARKAASATSLFTALAMVIGAFIACIAAALGGQQRDEHP